jgi:hypothetical protein
MDQSDNDPAEMGNRPSSLSYRLRYNDRTLTELDLTSAPVVEDFHELCRCMKRNSTVRSVVLMTGFTDQVMGPLWTEFLASLVSLQALEQVELLETSVPFDSLTRLVQHVPTLKALAVHEGISEGISAMDVSSLAEAFHGAQHLEEFGFENDFRALARETNALDPLVVALSQLPTLTLLGLSNCGLEHSFQLLSPSALASLCRSSHELQTLDLSGCGLTDEHFQVLREGLGNHTALRKLHVQRNRGGPRSFAALIELLQQNYRLHSMVTDAAGQVHAQLEIWLFLNEHVREPLALSPNRLWSIVQRMRTRPDALFYLLQEYPELWQSS